MKSHLEALLQTHGHNSNEETGEDVGDVYHAEASFLDGGSNLSYSMLQSENPSMSSSHIPDNDGVY